MNEHAHPVEFLQDQMPGDNHIGIYSPSFQLEYATTPVVNTDNDKDVFYGFALLALHGH